MGDVDDVRALEVEPEASGERLDHYLARSLPDHSRVEAKRWIEEGRVRIEGASPPLKANRKVRPGERISVAIPPPRVVSVRPEPVKGLRVIHEDDSILVIDKAAGLLVHPAPGQSSGTLVNALLYQGGDLSTLGGDERPGLVHRLDRDTSGVMVVARTDDAHRSLVEQFKARETGKEYLAIVEGHPREDRGAIDAPIGRHPRDRTRMAVRTDGRPARTRYEVVERYPKHALVRCRPETGRTHQIRLHLARLGTPILCDAVYGRRFRVSESELRGRKKAEGETPVLGRQALHARRLAFRHPGTGARVEFEAPVPRDLEATLAILREEAAAAALPAARRSRERP